MQDANSGGGIIQSIPQDFVKVDGRLVAVVGSRGSAHPPCPEDDSHCAGVWQTTRGAPRVRIKGIPVIRAFDPDSCSHMRVGGSTTTRVGDGGGVPGGPNEWDTGRWDEMQWQP
jgi:uncharacterized Zn-binding protein involved in type VI secretion